MSVNNKWLAVCALLTVLAALTGLLESLLSLSFFLPLPGVKLGFANIFLVAAFYFYGAKYAFFVYAARVLLGFLFGGNPVSFALSLAGGLLAYVSLFLSMPLAGKRLSFIGVSALAAASHATGQLLCATVFIGRYALIYLPLLGTASVVTGTLTGAVMNLVLRPLAQFLRKKGVIS